MSIDGLAEHLKLRRPSTPAWLLRLTVESFFMIMSILAALAVDNWRDNTNNHRLAMQSLRIFEREIRQNLARLDDVAPYHSGLRVVVSQARTDSTQRVDVRSVIEGLQPTVLLNTAWQTSLATGALTHIDVETVSALSLTYSIQQRFVEDDRLTLPAVLSMGADVVDERHDTMRRIYMYLNDLVAREQQLRAVYQQALETISKVSGGTVPQQVATRPQSAVINATDNSGRSAKAR